MWMMHHVTDHRGHIALTDWALGHGPGRTDWTGTMYVWIGVKPVNPFLPRIILYQLRLIRFQFFFLFTGRQFGSAPAGPRPFGDPTYKYKLLECSFQKH